MNAPNTAIIEEIVDQYFDEAAFLWSQRDIAATAIGYNLSDLVFMDERIEAHIDGLRVAGDYGWQLCEAGLNPEDPGTVFAASVIAFESGDKEHIDLVVAASNETRAAFRAAVSALGWMNNIRFNALITGLVSDKSRLYRRLGVAACGIRGINPRTYLDQAANSGDLFLKTLALKVAGRLKRLDLLPLLLTHLQHEDQACRFEAARSALLMGDKSAMDTIRTFLLSKSRYSLPAMQVGLRVVDGPTALNWLKTMYRSPEQRRQMLIGIGIAGDPAFIPMLIKQMKNPELARVAGDAFSMITGVDLEAENLEGEWPDGFEAGPNDDPDDDNVDLDEDEALSWPEADLVAQWWADNHQALHAGNRYLAGSIISAEHCSYVLENGSQRHRQAAALELALASPEAPLTNTRKPGHRPTKLS